MPNRAPSLLMTSSACVAFDDDETEGEAATAGGAAGGGTSSGISGESDAGFCRTGLDPDFAGPRDPAIVMGEGVCAPAGTAPPPPANRAAPALSRPALGVRRQHDGGSKHAARERHLRICALPQTWRLIEAEAVGDLEQRCLPVLAVEGPRAPHDATDGKRRARE